MAVGAQPAMNKRLLMLFVVSDYFASRLFLKNLRWDRKLFLSTLTKCFRFERRGGREKKSQKFNKAEHESNFVCTKIIINILCFKFDLTAKIFKFCNET